MADEPTAAGAKKPVRKLTAILGGEPSAALRAAWKLLRECTGAELDWLKLDGIRAVQLERVVTVKE